MSAPVIPVGHTGGAQVRPAAESPSLRLVRVGRIPEQLTDEEFATWLVAHGSPEPESGPWTRSDLIAAGPAFGLPDIEHHTSDLVARGMLAEISDAATFAHRYRLRPLFLGLSNSPDDPEHFTIGIPGLEPLAVVTTEAFELWQWGWVSPSLWAHCEVLATITEQDADQPSPPEAYLESVLTSLHTLVANQVAYVDPVPDRPSP